MNRIKFEKEIGDILIAKETTNDEIQTVISSLCSCDDLIVINSLDECVDLPLDTNWIVHYHDDSSRFPCLISPYSFNINPSKQFEIAKALGVEIAWSSDEDEDPNPAKWTVVYPNGLEQTEFIDFE